MLPFHFPENIFLCQIDYSFKGLTISTPYKGFDNEIDYVAKASYMHHLGFELDLPNR